MQQPARIMVADDHLEMARIIAEELEGIGYEVEPVSSGAEAIARAKLRPPDLLISDLRMESIDGFDLIEAFRAFDPPVPVLIMTAFGAIDTAIEAIKRGAYHYFSKPFRLDEVKVYVERALAEQDLQRENVALRRAAAEKPSVGAMVGRTPTMQALYALIDRVAQSTAPVLVRGESGTGKELIARALHFQGVRKSGPFIPINCTALPEALLESELFGHTKGAFTGAANARRGLFVEASGGTLFLDEIGDMPLDLQGKLLRVLAEGEVRAVGGTAATKVDVRIIAATHRDLEQRVKEQSFRADLFYRLNVVPIAVPPLRARTADVPLLAQHFLERALAKNPSSRVKHFAPEAIAALARHPWPGNVRELQNVIERLVIVSTSEVVGTVDLEMHASAVVGDTSPLAEAKERILPLRQLENEYIRWVVARCDGNKTRAAELLGIDVSTIHRRLQP